MEGATRVAFAVCLSLALLVGTGGTVTTAAETTQTVDSCRTIEEPGTYRLTADFGGGAALDGGCIEIVADDVILDGDGHTIDGVDSADAVGVVARDVDDVVVRDVRTINWGTGVRFEGVTNGEISGVEAVANRVGIFLRETSDTVVSDTLSEDNARDGVFLLDSDHNRVVDSEVVRNGGSGVGLNGEDVQPGHSDAHNVIEETRIADNGGSGVSVDSVSFLRIRRNDIVGNYNGVVTDNVHELTVSENRIADHRRHGVTTEDTSNFTIRDNVVTDSEQVGIDIDNYAIGTVSGNTVSHSDTAGIVVSTRDTVVLSDNRVEENNDGIELNDASGVEVSNNRVRNNDDDGIHVTNSHSLSITDNAITDNGDDGLYWTTAAFVDDPSDSTVDENVFAGNDDDGIDLHYTTGVTLRDNVIGTNGDDGVFFRNADRNVVTENEILANRDDGVDLRTAHDNEISDNVICDNGEDRIVIRRGATGNDVSDNERGC